jgi:RNA polymerase sigma factor for flagellar operon FliA
MEDRAQLLAKYGPYVRSLANTVRKQFNARLDIEDLVAYGNVGLFEAAERFDPKVGANFLTFAHYRIKGAIFDGLRKMGTLKGPDQRAAYLSDRTNSFLSTASATDTVRARNFSDDVREVESAVTSLAAVFATSLEGMEHLQIRDESLSPEERLELTELKQRVRAAIDKLPDNEKQLLVGYYYEGKTLEDAGQAIGQSKSWASRLHARAIERIKDFLAQEMSVPDRDGPSGDGFERSKKPSDSPRPATGTLPRTVTH